MPSRRPQAMPDAVMDAAATLVQFVRAEGGNAGTFVTEHGAVTVSRDEQMQRAIEALVNAYERSEAAMKVLAVSADSVRATARPGTLSVSLTVPGQQGLSDGTTILVGWGPEMRTKMAALIETPHAARPHPMVAELLQRCRELEQALDTASRGNA